MQKKELIENVRAFLKAEYVIREQIRHYISLVLMDSDEEHPMDLDITLENDRYVGLSTLEMPRIVSAWQHPSEGWIYFQFDGYGSPTDFDDISTDDLITIVENIL